PPEIDWKRGILKTEPLFTELFRKRKEKKRNLAYSVEEYLAKGLAEIAIAYAEKTGIPTIAVAGGCTYNAHISQTIRKVIEQHGLKLIRNKSLPPGDGGISFGQAVVTGAYEGYESLDR
ncbi:MAG: carbamoyltransferase HypF, partial [Thermoplasmata archaeon]